jgi:hypothetical protein
MPTKDCVTAAIRICRRDHDILFSLLCSFGRVYINLPSTQKAPLPWLLLDSSPLHTNTHLHLYTPSTSLVHSSWLLKISEKPSCSTFTKPWTREGLHNSRLYTYVSFCLCVLCVSVLGRLQLQFDLCCAVNILYRFLTDLDCSKRKSIYTHSHTHPPSIHYPSHP